MLSLPRSRTEQRYPCHRKIKKGSVGSQVGFNLMSLVLPLVVVVVVVVVVNAITFVAHD